MSNDRGKLIIVAGGAGFIGSNLCERLVSKDNNVVVCIDNLSTGREENISKLMKKSNFIFVRKDVADGVNDWYNADEIYNLACPASPVHYQADGVGTIRTNVVGTMNLLELARISGARFLQASTSEVYGDPEIHPQPESYWGNVNPNGIRSCYDEGKRCAESLCMNYFYQYGVPVKIVRIFNTYGPKMRSDDGRVVSNFITQALCGKPITVYGDGNQTRSFQYIDDLLNGVELMMKSGDDFVGPVNLGNPEEFTVNELAKKVVSLTHSHSFIEHSFGTPIDDPKRRKPSISIAKEKLNWQPSVSLNDGLTKTIDYFKSYV